MKRDDFFTRQAELGVGLTFDDATLLTGYSGVHPRDVVLETCFSRRIQLKIPIISAAMDRVTEHRMAIALASLGGIGVIHRNMDPEQQAREVERVKFYLNGRIDRPISVKAHETIGEIQRRRDDKGWPFQSFPVLDENSQLQGVLTGNDFRHCDDLSQKAGEIMTREVVTGPPETTVKEAYAILQREKRGVLPLIDENRCLTGMYVFSDLKRILTESSSTYNMDERGNLRVAAAIGTGEDAVKRARSLAKAGVDALVIDTAHADTADIIKTIEHLRSLSDLRSVDLVVGNVSHPASVKRLAQAAGRGVDAIKVGQGPGSICTTRVVAGTGRSQLTAIWDCAREAARCELPVVADGGIHYSGDVTKALAAGASCVMVGGMLAGTEESPGEKVLYQGTQMKEYRGMGSVAAMENSSQAAQRYLQDSVSGKLVPEGIEALVPYRGLVSDVIFQCLGGLRSGMGAVGAATIEELQRVAEFERNTSVGTRESHPHDVLMSKDAPNYQRSF